MSTGWLFNVYLDTMRVSILIEAVLPTLSMLYLPFNQFAPGILLVFLNRWMGLFLAKNAKKFLAINNFLGQ